MAVIKLFKALSRFNIEEYYRDIVSDLEWLKRAFRGIMVYCMLLIISIMKVLGN